MATNSVVGILSAAVRLRNSRSGNPKWRITVAGRKYLTSLDSMAAFKISPPSHLGEIVMIELNSADRIVDYRFLNGEQDV